MAATAAATAAAAAAAAAAMAAVPRVEESGGGGEFEGYTCRSCTLKTPPPATACAACAAPLPAPCPACTLINTELAFQCRACGLRLASFSAASSAASSGNSSDAEACGPAGAEVGSGVDDGDDDECIAGPSGRRQPAAAQWECEVCEMMNGAEARQCGVCGTSSSLDPVLAGYSLLAPGDDDGEYGCSGGLHDSSDDRPYESEYVPFVRPGGGLATGCLACGYEDPDAGAVECPLCGYAEAAGWTCVACDTVNAGNADNCAMCATPNLLHG
ncbi:uncharacterized protein AMSG_01562 [Thecamonas trahens ATCC 50062]|uniref:RanBP2-type domain-containing protein n=1 Tax=Thecamonas trahens ATCC 50062 TaxID=461836 RepID=A0A0L0DR02_THETB|nr:hypothetical protein AMSG_01562 [Thecamonas trahens ATCC 50062]KNC54712.1 hypothetical protein AMSG_01562 [Thecamonas trahens ATCC 50062]|eukprot:XP_013761612.1 hypothetical protein AMSG_01562 [Thecamonas trahens ATCC 50062]